MLAHAIDLRILYFLDLSNVPGPENKKLWFCYSSLKVGAQVRKSIRQNVAAAWPQSVTLLLRGM
jgi:hypothetical protein